MEIADLKPNARNPRRISAEKREMLKKALDRFGDLGGIVFNRQTGQLVGGHQRVSVLPKTARIESAPVERTNAGTVAEGFVTINGERFKYREVDWDLATEEAANIAANQHGGEWDNGKLTEIVNDLFKSGIDMDLLGFSKDELDALLPETVKEGECDEDEVPDQVPAVSVLGDVYELGAHRLVCGDSTSIDAVEKLMNGEKADMVFTDPPYGMKLDTDYSKMGNSGKKHTPVIGDNDDFTPELIQTCLGFFCDVPEVFMFGADYYSELIHEKNKGSWIVWDKRSKSENEIGTLDGAFGSDFELCWSKQKHKREIARVLRETGAFAIRGDDKPVHPTQKPIKLIEWFFERWGKPLDRVVDLFGGSGSTLIACEKTNRRCFMMELDPHYVDVIVSRYVKFTGNDKIIRNGEHVRWTTDKV